MTFWKKYNKYIRMAIVLAIYLIVMFTSIYSIMFKPLSDKLGMTVYGCQSYIILGNVLIYLILFTFTIFLLPDIYYVDFKIFKKTPGGLKAAYIGIGYGALIVMTIIGNVFTQTMGGAQDSVNESTIDAVLSADIAWIYVPVCCIIGPIVEEIIFRGVLQGAIIGNKFQSPSNPRVFVGIIVSSLIFGLIHVYDAGDYIQIFPYLFMGLALGSLAYASKSIYPSIIVHIINNTISVLATYATLMMIK